MLVKNLTRRMLWSIPVPRGTCSTICPSFTASSLSHPGLSSWATTRQPAVLRLEKLCFTGLMGVVFAFPSPLCALPRQKPPERVPACKEGHHNVVHQDRMCLDGLR
jgi:hypothetical protein